MNDDDVLVAWCEKHNVHAVTYNGTTWHLSRGNEFHGVHAKSSVRPHLKKFIAENDDPRRIYVRRGARGTRSVRDVIRGWMLGL